MKYSIIGICVVVLLVATAFIVVADPEPAYPEPVEMSETFAETGSGWFTDCTTITGPSGQKYALGQTRCDPGSGGPGGMGQRQIEICNTGGIFHWKRFRDILMCPADMYCRNEDGKNYASCTAIDTAPPVPIMTGMTDVPDMPEMPNMFP